MCILDIYECVVAVFLFSLLLMNYVSLQGLSIYNILKRKYQHEDLEHIFYAELKVLVSSIQRERGLELSSLS